MKQSKRRRQKKMLIYCKTRGKWYNHQPLFWHELSFLFILFPSLHAHFFSSAEVKFFTFIFPPQRGSILIMSNTFYIISQKAFTAFSLFFFSFQEVGSIIGKKGEIVKRFREEVSYCYASTLWWLKISHLKRRWSSKDNNLSLSNNEDLLHMKGFVGWEETCSFNRCATTYKSV